MSTDLQNEQDPVGEETLDVIGRASRFNRWMYLTIQPYLQGRVLEIGSGIGNISAHCLDDGFPTMLSDLRSHYCMRLKDSFSAHPGFLGAEPIDLVHPDFNALYKTHLESYDSVFALNVVEHIEDHQLALKNAARLLKPGGNLVILVPSYEFLYNNFDKGLGHFRRYTVSQLSNLMQAAELRIIHRQYFNFAGIFGWYISGMIQKNSQIPGGQMALYEKLVPLFKLADWLVLKTSGLSSIVVGKK